MNDDDEFFIKTVRWDARAKRYKIISNKINDFVIELAQKGSKSVEDEIYYGRLMEEAHEALLGCYQSLVENIRLLEMKLEQLDEVENRLKELKG